MKIIDISADKNKVQSLKTLSDKEAIKIVGGDRSGSSDPAPRSPKRLGVDKYILIQLSNAIKEFYLKNSN